MENQARVSIDLSMVLAGGRLTWSGSPTLDRSSQRIHSRRKSSLIRDDGGGSGESSGDDFDDFEESAQIGDDDDFGDFGDGFEGPPSDGEVVEPATTLQMESPPTFVSRLCSRSSQSTLACKALSSILMLIS
jgi:Domain of unknown function (DUF5102)